MTCTVVLARSDEVRTLEDDFEGDCGPDMWRHPRIFPDDYEAILLPGVAPRVFSPHRLHKLGGNVGVGGIIVLPRVGLFVPSRIDELDVQVEGDLDRGCGGSGSGGGGCCGLDDGAAGAVGGCHEEELVRNA